ncbi:Hemolysin activation/secretion protein [Polaribacter sp. KT25b]|nr:Hemolysin activation/secretion protein [Polaribacter sp. KT25b]
MNKKITHYIYVLFFIFFSSDFIAQKINLKITSKSNIDNLILEEVDFKKTHNNTTSINSEVNKVSNYLKNIGYFTNTIDSIITIKNKQIAYFSLNEKTKNARIRINNNINLLQTKYKIENKIISIPIKKIKALLLEISNSLEKQGRSFSKVQLKNIYIKDKILFGETEILSSEKRNINKLIVKGYKEFPNSYLKNHFNLKLNSVFNQKKIKDISNSTKSIQFIKEIKPPEILFTKDSTILYLYLKKIQNNSFDGIISFTSKENGKVVFNGNINLKLHNILNTGEKFELFWNSIGGERQEFKILTEIPYIFNSTITPEISFSIYKQDSTFLNTNFNSKIKYSITRKLKIGLSYNTETSSELEQPNYINNINNFTNNFIGFQLSYTKPKFDLFYNNKFSLEINPSIGKRKSKNNTSNQYKLRATTSYIFDINYRNSIYIKNDTGLLNSDTYLNNELFRIGGANSIRGYNEQSIFTKSYTFFNLEYRFLTTEKSYLYSITDIGKIKENNNKLLSFGLGYKFINNSSFFNIGAAISKDQTDQILLKNTKIIIDWSIYF